MNLDRIGTLVSGEDVWTYESSHIHAGVNAVLAEVLAKMSPEGGFVRTTVDLGRVVGHDNCVPTTDADEIVFAQREGRQGLTRFTKSAEPVATSEVSVIMCRDKEHGGRWTLITAFFGALAPREPWDPNIKSDSERVDAREFWSSHALAWGSDPIVADTETMNSPW